MILISLGFFRCQWARARWKMADRNFLNRWICIGSVLTVLVAVLTSPLCPLTPQGTLSRPHCLRRNFAIPPTRSAYLSPKSLIQRAAPVKAVRSENEEEKLGRAVCPALCSLGPPPASTLK